MFNKARLALTGWYLLIIMTISFAFSLFIYRFAIIEVQRFARMQRFKFEQGIVGNDPFGPTITLHPVPLLEPELVEETQQRILTALVLVNGGILITAGCTGYFLAGRTLKPIQIMVDEQNRFLSDASHELRTPITALKANLEVHLRDSKLNLVEAKQLIKESVEDVNRLQNLSEGMLMLVNYEQTSRKNVYEGTTIKELIDKAVKKVEPLAKQKRIQIIKEASETDMICDTDSITRILIILVDNAIKYSSSGGQVKVIGRTKDGMGIFEVIDHGIGIEKKSLPKVFERFFRADTARTTGGASGYGLGLAIAKKIIEDHKGTISVASKPGVETIFKIKLPRKP